MSHAILSASAAHRWMHCPPSARLAQKYPNESSSYAEEGTAAHALAEVRLGEALELQGYNVSWSHANPPVKNEYYGPEMEGYVNGYVAQVLERVNAQENPYVLLEQRLHFGDYVPHGFGTGDVIILSDLELEIIDLKYGKGVPVDATRNPQLMLYGLGALLTFGQLYGFLSVRVTVMQPRLDSVSSYAMSVEDLYEWAEQTVKPTAKLAWEGAGEFAAGDWCRFCPAAGECRKRAEVNVELAKNAFNEPATLRNDEIAEILAKLPDWESWAKDLKERALDKALHEGAKFPGFKLVLGRSTRKYKNAQAVVEKLTADGYEVDTIAPREPLGITAMTKVLGKKRFEDELGDLITRTAGKPTLAPETDKRAEYRPAADAFKDYTEQLADELKEIKEDGKAKVE